MAGSRIVGEDELRRVLARLASPSEIVSTVTGPMVAEATRILYQESQPIVPYRNGTLAGSAAVLSPIISGTRVEIRFGYGGAASAYALVVHENPRSGRTGGASPQGRRYRTWATNGQWKYLEGPVKAAASVAWMNVAANVKQRLERIGR